MKFSRAHAYKLSKRKNRTNEKHAARSQFKFKIATSTDSFHPKSCLIQNHRGNPQSAKMRFAYRSSLQLSRLRRALNLRRKDRIKI